jgi:fumarate reductase flavoprotein subunit
VVLEKRGLGGNSALAFGIFAAESPVQRREMIDCRKDDCFKLAMDFAHWKVNPRIVRAFIDKSGDTIRWLEEKGLEFSCIPFYLNQAPRTWHIPKGNGAALVKTLIQNCQDLGVTLLPRTPAKKILTSTKGGVSGVLAKTKGEDLAIKTRSVIIATGGYGGNRRLLKKYCADPLGDLECDGIHHSGDGLVMVMEMGAATEGLGMLHMAGPTTPDNIILKLGTPPNVLRVRFMAFVLEPYSVWVNKRGERFIDESFGCYHYESSNAAVRQPDNVTYTLLDGKMIQTMTEEGLLVAMGLPEGAQGNKLPGLERELRALVARGLVKISDSWDAIADWMGTDPGALKTTIEEYNSACDCGHDSIFAKDRSYLLPLRTPPYYAIRCRACFLSTLGGIKINEHMEVLDQQDNPIPGLYAAGVDVGGWESDTYCDRLSGSAFGFAVNSGRIAGENAARYSSSH